MSFQHFRLGEIALHQPLPPHLVGPSTTSSFPAQVESADISFSGNTHKQSKQPYGSGDSDDGYTLVFSNLEAFHEWRAKEEERQSVEFVKGDTHGSKAVPPRFKDHTKLVCARHSRSGRKKYVKKHPERIRKVPSRKLEGVGCPASISYKTYFDTDEVRACYMSQHSHEIGPANLPFTRRGRKAAALRDKERSRNNQSSSDASTSLPIPPSLTPTPAVANSVNTPKRSSSTHQPANLFTSAVSMLAPLPGQPPYQQQPYAFSSTPQPYTTSQPVRRVMSHDRWENMATLFHSVRDHARVHEYPAVSVAALETILIRLYLESPVNVEPNTQLPMAAVMPNSVTAPPGAAATQLPTAHDHVQASGSADGNTSDSSEAEDSS